MRIQQQIQQRGVVAVDDGQDFADEVSALMGLTRRMVTAERTRMNRPSHEVKVMADIDYVGALLDLMDLVESD